MAKAKFTSVEVCAGAGGQAVGLETAGFDHLACVEIDAHACSTLRANRPEWNVIEADLRDWKPAADLYGVDLLAGGVPCPPFSLAGKQLGKDDERDLFPEMIRLAKQLNPNAIMIENVRGILGRKFDDYREEIVVKFTALGYEFCGWELLNSADFGVPQSRKRSILVIMKPEVAKNFNFPKSDASMRTIGDVLEPFMAEGGWTGASAWAQYAQGLAPALVGGSKKHGGADLGPTRAKQSWRELGVDGLGVADSPPSPDFVGFPRLTVKMAAAVQGFPAEWDFQGRKTAAYRQIGNAFPPPVAQAVGQAIQAALAADRR
ncbi:MAG: Modification methylase AplI [Nitrosomonadaceae bacterium]|nr:Modification methylase AplI [Nitrosomonadaceae bacterium]